MHELVTILPIAAEETIPLRMAVLRPGLPRESALFAEDARALHFGAFLEGELVGIVSLHQEDLPGEAAPGWRFRGMATEETTQGRGIGGGLLRACAGYAAARGGAILWCNARVSASDFYANHGFEIRGDEFDIPGVGPHYVMWRRVA